MRHGSLPPALPLTQLPVCGPALCFLRCCPIADYAALRLSARSASLGRRSPCSGACSAHGARRWSRIPRPHRIDDAFRRPDAHARRHDRRCRADARGDSRKHRRAFDQHASRSESTCASPIVEVVDDTHDTQMHLAARCVSPSAGRSDAQPEPFHCGERIHCRGASAAAREFITTPAFGAAQTIFSIRASLQQHR